MRDGLNAEASGERDWRVLAEDSEVPTLRLNCVSDDSHDMVCGGGGMGERWW